MHSKSIKPRIVSVGECMVEMAPTAVPGTYAMGFAGDTLNTAWYLRRALSAVWQVDYLTAIGTDAISDRMLAFLAAAGIGCGHISRRADRTVGLYLIELSGAERSFSYWRGQSAARLLAHDPAVLAAAFAGAGMIYLSGITLAILDDADRARLFTALDHARAQGALIVFDPNMRPRLWPDVATMCDVVTQATARTDIALPSYDDEAAFFGDTAPKATARRYAQAGAGLVVVKNGARAIICLTPDGMTCHTPEVVAEVVDTTAAGDSFNAGFLAAYLSGASVTAAIRAGAVTAARVITRSGALVG